MLALSSGCQPSLFQSSVYGADLSTDELQQKARAAHGVIDASLLYESPFTNLTPQGPDAMFSFVQIDELMAVLEQVRATAIAA